MSLAKSVFVVNLRVIFVALLSVSCVFIGYG